MHSKDKLDVILKVLGPVSDPNIDDIRIVRAIGKKRINLNPFRPLYTLIKRYASQGEVSRRWREIRESSFSGKRTRLQEPKRVSLTSSIRQLFFYHSEKGKTGDYSYENRGKKK